MDTWEVDYVAFRMIKKTSSGVTIWPETDTDIYCLYYNSGTPGGSWVESTSYNSKYLKIGNSTPTTGSKANYSHTHTVPSGTTDTETQRWGNGGYKAQCQQHHSHSYSSTTSGSANASDPNYVYFRLVNLTVKGYKDVGITYRDNSGVTQKIGVETLTSSHKLRVRGNDGATYGIPLLDTTDEEASELRIYDGANIKALPKIL